MLLPHRPWKSLGQLAIAWLGLSAANGCSLAHNAPVRTAALPPPNEPVVRHSARLWLDIFPGVSGTQCVMPPQATREVCFDAVEEAVQSSLSRVLWTSFPRVDVLGRGDSPAPEDYVLHLELDLSIASPDAAGPGWAALAKGNWQLKRGSEGLAGEQVESRSRADFPYGSALGQGAGEVVDAIAMHIGVALGAIPESRPERPVPLPPVHAEKASQASKKQVAAR